MNLGAEWTWKETLALRAGYQNLFQEDSELGTDPRASASRADLGDDRLPVRLRVGRTTSTWSDTHRMTLALSTSDEVTKDRRRACAHRVGEDIGAPKRENDASESAILRTRAIAGGRSWRSPGSERAGADHRGTARHLQHTAFDFFWNEANPANGLIRDRSASGSPCSIASAGFGLSAICIGIDHGWVTREEGRRPRPDTLNTFWTGPQGTRRQRDHRLQGALLPLPGHEHRLRGPGTSELSTIDTALLFAGILDAKQYFDTDDSAGHPDPRAGRLDHHRADWEFMRQLRPRDPHGLEAGHRVRWLRHLGRLQRGHDPVHPGPGIARPIRFRPAPGSPGPAATTGRPSTGTPTSSSRRSSATSTRTAGSTSGTSRTTTCGRKGITYFENSRRATLAARDYCIDNPVGWSGYGENAVGLDRLATALSATSRTGAAGPERRRHHHAHRRGRLHRLRPGDRDPDAALHLRHLRRRRCGRPTGSRTPST